jgi:hypothetical protein
MECNSGTKFLIFLACMLLVGYMLYKRDNAIIGELVVDNEDKKGYSVVPTLRDQP